MNWRGKWLNLMRECCANFSGCPHVLRCSNLPNGLPVYRPGGSDHPTESAPRVCPSCPALPNGVGASNRPASGQFVRDSEQFVILSLVGGRSKTQLDFPIVSLFSGSCTNSAVYHPPGDHRRSYAQCSAQAAEWRTRRKRSSACTAQCGSPLHAGVAEQSFPPRRTSAPGARSPSKQGPAIGAQSRPMWKPDRTPRYQPLWDPAGMR